MRLKAATAAAHARAERSVLMRRLMRGELPRPSYCRLLFALRGLYTVLDTALAVSESPLWHPALGRSASLARDLQHLHGEGWEHELDAGGEARAYAARLRQHEARADHALAALAAHAYVRYMGDLHGGQMLAASTQRAYGLAPGEGVAFYDFGSAQQVQALRAHLRAALAALPLTPAQDAEVVAEACWAFEAHERMFAELA